MDNFKNRVAKTIVKTQFQENKVLLVSTPQLLDVTHYACYLIINDSIVEKKKYQLKREFIFDISSYTLNDEMKLRVYFFNKAINEKVGKTFNITELRLRDFILRPEIDKLKNRQMISLGSNLINQQMLELRPFLPYKIDQEFNFWEENPFNSRTWLWKLHWFEYLMHLLAYYDATKDTQALELGKKSIESWWKSYWYQESDFEFVWHDHATALRAEVLLVFYCYVEEYDKAWFNKNYSFFSKLRLFILSLKDKLLIDDFYSEHTNHGLEQSRVLLLLCIYFNIESGCKIAVERISSELDYSFTSEGVHKENSPGYHQFVLKLFLDIISRFPKNLLGDLSYKFEVIGSKALSYLAHIIRPDGNLPIIGDTQLIKATDSYSEYFLGDDAYKYYCYSSSKGCKGQAPNDLFKVYEESGYAIYRDIWGNKDNFDQSVHLVLKAGCLSQYHHQQDENNIVLFAYGEDWLIDSGLYKYDNKDPIRKYMRRREAHNVPIIPHCLYSPDFSHRVANWSLSGKENKEYYFISGVNRVLQTVEHRRNILILKDQKIGYFKYKVCDEIVSLDNLNRSVDFLWHIPSDKVIKIEDKKIYIHSKKSKKILVIELSLNAEVTVSTGIVGRKVLSCISEKTNKVLDSYLVRISFNASKEGKFDFDFHFINKD